MYVKLFDQMLNSSIMDEDIHTRWIWIILLLMADKDGTVYGTPGAIARRANAPLEETVRCLERLQAPDPDSTTPDEEGRRIEQVSKNTWSIINYEKYRQIKDAETVREKTRIRVQRHRARKKGEDVTQDVTNGNADVTRGNPIAEAEEDTYRNPPIVPPTDRGDEKSGDGSKGKGRNRKRPRKRTPRKSPEQFRDPTQETPPPEPPPAAADDLELAKTRTEAQDLWTSVCDLLRDQIDKPNMETWIDPMVPLGLHDGVLVLEVPDVFFAKWVRDNHVAGIRAALAEVGHDQTDVEVRVAGEAP